VAMPRLVNFDQLFTFGERRLNPSFHTEWSSAILRRMRTQRWEANLNRISLVL